MSFPETRLSYGDPVVEERKDAAVVEDVERIDLTEEFADAELQALFDAMEAEDYETADELTLAAEGRYEEAEAVKVAGQNVSPKDQENTQRLREYWAHGKGAAKVRWGQKGDFGRCVRLVSKFMRPDQAKGFCNLRHKEALGFYPATHAAMDRAGKGKKDYRDVFGAPAHEQKAGGMKFKNGDMVKAKGSPDGVSPMGVVTGVNEGENTVTVKHSKGGGKKGTVSKTYKPGDLTMVRSSNDSGPDKGKPKPPWLQKKDAAVLEGSLEDLAVTLGERYAAEEMYDPASVQVIGTFPDRFVALVPGEDEDDEQVVVEVPYVFDADADAMTFGDAVEAEVPEEAKNANAISDTGERQLSAAEELEAETKGFYLDLPGTWESTMRSIQAAVREQFTDDGDGDSEADRMKTRQWAHVVGTYDDRVIVEIEAPYAETTGPNTHYVSVPYTVGDDGTVDLGDPVDVQASVTLNPSATPDTPATSPEGGPAGRVETPEDGVLGGVKVAFEGLTLADLSSDDRMLAIQTALRG